MGHLCYASGTRLPYEGAGKAIYGRGLATVHYPAPVLVNYGITTRARWPSTDHVTHYHTTLRQLVASHRHISRCTACDYHGQQFQAVIVITGRRYIIRRAACSLLRDCPHRMTRFGLEASHWCTRSSTRIRSSASIIGKKFLGQGTKFQAQFPISSPNPPIPSPDLNSEPGFPSH